MRTSGERGITRRERPEGRQRSAPAATATAAGGRVRWIGPEPSGFEERAVFEAVSRDGGSALDQVVGDLARALYYRDLWSGGGATDIGLLRGLYRREARHVLQQLDGVLVRIE